MLSLALATPRGLKSYIYSRPRVLIAFINHDQTMNTGLKKDDCEKVVFDFLLNY
jgi:hypothetical protein